MENKKYTCAICGIFLNKNSHNQKYCKKCAKNHKYQPKNYNCIVCNANFTNKWKKNTCSPECEKILRSQKSTERQPKGHKLSPELRQKCIDRGIAESVRLAHMANPKTGAFDTNIHAKSWVLQDPCGNIYNITNLQNFFRKHPELIPETTYSKATKRIQSLKYTGHKWHGWKLIAWYDDFTNR